MTIILLDNRFMPIKVVDEYESIIWTDRYDSPGDFEYYNLANKDILQEFKIGYYLINNESEHAMIIETIQLISDVEDGDRIRITGRSLESILYRRIIWGQTLLKGNLQSEIEKVFINNIISPSIVERKIENFIFIENPDERLNSLYIESQYTGDNIGELIVDLCISNNLGYKIIFDSNYNYCFQLYFGIDRSDGQDVLPVVTFSFDYDNVLNMDYTEDSTLYCNVAYVAGEGEGSSRKNVYIGDASGIDRKELYVDARDISSNSGSISVTEYQNQMKQRGLESLKDSSIQKIFNGEVDVNGLFKYKEDFMLGDIVNFYDKYGNKRRVRVSEVIFNDSSEGYTCYPSFIVMED